ncbi:SdpI family protein [Microbacterium sp. C23T]
MVLAVLAWVFTALLGVLVISCLAASVGRLRRNRYFGVKLPALEKSDDAWREGHRAAVMPATVSFAVAAVAAIVGVFVPLAYVVTIMVAVFGVIWVFVRSTRAATRP